MSNPNELVLGLPSTDWTAFGPILSVLSKIEANRSAAWVLHRHKQDLGLGARGPSEFS